MHIIPAILPHSFEELESAVSLVRGTASWVQVDLCDAKFVPSRTWPYVQGGFQRVHPDTELPYWQDVNYEFDLMVSDPVMVVDKIMELGAMRAVLHVGSAPHEEILKALRALEHYDMEAVLAVSNDRDLEELYALLDAQHPVHAVQCMGIANPGFQGEAFDERVLTRIKAIKEKYPEILMSVDGCVNESTLPQLVAVGVGRLVVGSAIFESGDAIGTIKTLERMFKMHDKKS